MNACSRLAVFALLLAPALASAELVETEIPDVTARVAELRASGGVTRLAIRDKNGGAKEFVVGRCAPMAQMRAARTSALETQPS